MDQNLNQEVSAYPDLKISNILQQGNFFPEEVVAAARREALQRGLFTEEQLAMVEQYPAIKNHIDKRLREDLTDEQILEQIQQQFGIDDEKGRELIANARKKLTAKAEASGGGMDGVNRTYIYVGAIILFFLFKMLLRMMR